MAQLAVNAREKLRETYSWKTFALLLSEVSHQTLIELREDITNEMENIMEDSDTIMEASLGLSGIEILLALFSRVGPAIFEEQLSKTAGLRVAEASKNNIAGVGMVAHALTHETIMVTALDLQDLCDKKMAELGSSARELVENCVSLSVTKAEDDPPSMSGTYRNRILAGTISKPFGESRSPNSFSPERTASIEQALVVSTAPIGADNHSPAKDKSYPLPGQWKSQHFRENSLDAKIAREKSDWIGINMAQHAHHVEAHLGTAHGLPVALWAGSLRDNSNYSEKVKGVKPMRFATSLRGDGRSKSSVSVPSEGRMPSTASTSASEKLADRILDGSSKKKNKGKQSEIMKRSAARRKRISELMKNIRGDGWNDGREYNYPLPGKTKSKYFKGGIDASRAHQRPYVGMNMNSVRMHIATGNGDGKAASNWVGTLRSTAKGASGGSEEALAKENSSHRNDAGELISDEITGQNKIGRPHGITEKKAENKDVESKYVGNKTEAQMTGVPVGMRRYKVKVAINSSRLNSPGKAYLRLAEKLAAPLVNEQASKFRMRDDTPHSRTRLHVSNANDAKKKKTEVDRRNRRRAYGHAAAARFKAEKAKRLKRKSAKEARERNKTVHSHVSENEAKGQKRKPISEDP